MSLGIPNYVYSMPGGYNHFTLLKQYIWDKNKNTVWVYSLLLMYFPLWELWLRSSSLTHMITPLLCHSSVTHTQCPDRRQYSVLCAVTLLPLSKHHFKNLHPSGSHYPASCTDCRSIAYSLSIGSTVNSFLCSISTLFIITVSWLPSA